MDNYEEYVVFKVTASDGREVELAVIDEFEFDHKSYVAAGIVENDTVNEDGVFIYKIKSVEPELEVEKITNPTEYEKVVEAYSNMSEE